MNFDKKIEEFISANNPTPEEIDAFVAGLEESLADAQIHDGGE